MVFCEQNGEIKFALVLYGGYEMTIVGFSLDAPAH